MGINASGTISLGGSTSGQSIDLELGQSATTQISLNDTNVRSLAGIASGAISLSNFYGKSTGYGYSSGTKSPVYGLSSYSTYPISGWTGLQNASGDDAYVNVPLPFTFYMYGTGYTSVSVISNSYLEFGGTSTAYSNLSASNPAYNKLFFGGADNSYQRVQYLSTSKYVRIRYEGNGSTSGTVGSSGIIVEITLFNPSYVAGGKAMIELCIGNHNRTTGVAMIANSTGALSSSYTIATNQSYIFLGDTSGNNYVVYTGYKATGVDY